MATITHNTQQPDPYATRGLYVHHAGPRQWESYRDGYWTGSTERTYSAAARWLFPGYSHGYPISYYPTDDGELIGDVLCADCAAADWIADPTQGFFSYPNEEQLEGAVICDNCYREISPLQCRLCFDPINERPWHRRTYAPLPVFRGDHGYHAIHGECLARLIAAPTPYEQTDLRPTKVGKLAYLIPSIDNQTYGGETIR